MWIRCPDAHEAIVSEEVFLKAGAVIIPCAHTGKHTGVRALFAHKIRCGHCGRALKHQWSKIPYYYCNGAKLNNGLGCFEGKLPVEEIKTVVLAAIKMEAAKALDGSRKRRRRVMREVDSRELLLSERGRLTAQVGLFDRRGIQLYEEFADGKLGRENYLTAKATLADELAAVQGRIAELTARLEQSLETAPLQDSEPLLRRVLKATDVTAEVLSLVEGIVIYDPEHIEIRLAFSDGNAVAVG